MWWQLCQIWKGSSTRVSFCNSNYSVLHPQFYEFTWSLRGCLMLTKFTRDYFIHERLCIYLLWEFHCYRDKYTCPRHLELSLGLLTSCSVPLCTDAPFQQMHPYSSSCSSLSLRTRGHVSLPHSIYPNYHKPHKFRLPGVS